MKKVLAILLAAVMLLSLTATAVNAEVQENDTEGCYYIIGTMNDWQLDPSYSMKGSDTFYFDLYMTPEDSFKIVYCPDGKTLDNAEYFPEGRGNAFNQENPIILYNGFYSFVFRPARDGGTDYILYDDYYYHLYNELGTGIQIWYYNCIYCSGRDPWVQSYDNSNPDPEHKEPVPGYYIVGTMTDWQINKRFLITTNVFYKFNGIRYVEYGPFSNLLTLRIGDKFKVAYSEDGVNVTKWYPDGEGNAYNEGTNALLHNFCGEGPYFCLTFYPDGNGEGYECYCGYFSLGCVELPSELDAVPIPAEGELFKAKLKNDYSLSDSDFSEYEELCYHKDKEGLTDWVLLKARSAQTKDQTFCDVIANRAYVQDSLSTPFESSYAVYDAAKKEFIPLTGDIVTQYKDLGRIFDKVGEGRLIGDVDSDGELSAIDCTFIQRYATRIGNWPENDEIENGELRGKLNMSYYSDFDRDGERDIVDATRLQRYVTAAG